MCLPTVATHDCSIVIKPSVRPVFPADIGPLLGGRINSQLEKEVVPSLDAALRMAGGNKHTHTHTLCMSFKLNFLLCSCSQDVGPTRLIQDLF